MSYFLIAQSDGLTVPFSGIVGVGVLLCGAIGTMFRMMISSHERRASELTVAFKELANKIDRLSEETREQWKATYQGNQIRLLELSVAPHVSPELREEAVSMIKAGESAIKKHERDYP
jgi:hypothetical protein